jgi:TRAP-type C4-dicarboxylate transport system permease small subunit
MRARRWTRVLLGLWCAAVLFALTWPGYHWLGNHIDPLVLGLPFSLAWIVGWCLSTCVVLGAYFLLERSEP